MFITAMYLYGISIHAWGFSWFYGLVAFIMDMMLAIIISPSIKTVNKTSEEDIVLSKEKAAYFRKKWEVEELKRLELDRRLYGG